MKQKIVKNIAKKLCGGVLALAMALTLAPVLPGGSTEVKAAGHNHTGAPAGVTWEAWGDDASEKTKMPEIHDDVNANETKYYYLDSDINLNDGWNVPQGATIHLCLNGKTIQLGDDSIHVYNNGAKLYIYDCCNPDENPHEGYIDESNVWILGTGDGTPKTMYGGMIIGGGYSIIDVFNDDDKVGELYLNGGTLTGSHGAPMYGYGAVSVNGGGTFVMNGGCITNNAATQANSGYSNLGGGVFVGSGSTFEMLGGEIKNNVAVAAGGGVCVAKGGTFKATGGEINGNMAQYGGGGVYVAMDTGNDSDSGNDPYTCLAAGTPITLADGSRTAIENLKKGDEVRVFDHDTGTLSTSKIFFVYKFPEKKGDVFVLHFSNGIDVTAVGGHCFFDKSANKYVNLTRENANSFIGHEFYNADEERWETLGSVDFPLETVDTYYAVSEKSLNTIANGMLSNVDEFYTAISNVFEFDENLKVDVAKKAADIEKYGIWEYDSEHFKYSTKAIYDAQNLQYLGVALGKGILTSEDLNKAIDFYTNNIANRKVSEENSEITEGQIPMMTSFALYGDGGDSDPGIYLGGSVKIAENFSVKGSEPISDNLFIWSDESAPKVNIVDGQKNMRVGITLKDKDGEDYTEGIFTTNGTDSDIKYFIPDNSGEYYVKTEGGKLKLATLQEDDKYPIMVGGTIVTKFNKGDVLGDGKVSYDPDKKTLTLDNAQIATGEAYKAIEGIRSQLEEGNALTVNLTGNNVIGRASDKNLSDGDEKNEEKYAVSTGIAVYEESRARKMNPEGTVRIVGSGSLTIYDYDAGIEAGSVTFGSDEGAFTGKLTVYDYGDSNCAIRTSGDVTINGGTFDLNSVKSNGITANTININGGEVIAKGGAQAMSVAPTLGAGVKVTKASEEFDGSNPVAEYSDTDIGSYKYLEIKKPGGVIPAPPANTGATIAGGETSGTDVSVNVSGGNATVSNIPSSVIESAANSEPDSKEIILDVSGTGSAGTNVSAVTLTKTTAENIVKALDSNTNNKETLTIKSDVATVSIDATALASIADQAKGEEIQLVVENTQVSKLNDSQKAEVEDLNKENGKEVIQTFEAYFVSGGSRISNFNGGQVTVGKIDYKIPAGKNPKNYHVYYVPQTGKPVRHTTWALKDVLYFITGHFSDYVIVYDDEEENGGPGEAQIAKNTITLNKGLKVSQTGKKVNVAWGKVANADGYIVYASYCGKPIKAVKTITNPATASYSFSKLDGKAINLKKNIKVVVKAYVNVAGKKVSAGKSIGAHVIGAQNAKYSNPKSITLAKKSVNLNAGKTYTIKARVNLVDASKSALPASHVKKLRYASNNKAVATVSESGKITAKSAGTATVYVYAANGHAKSVKVTVK